MLLSGSEWSPRLQGSSLETREYTEEDACSEHPRSFPVCHMEFSCLDYQDLRGIAWGAEQGRKEVKSWGQKPILKRKSQGVMTLD